MESVAIGEQFTVELNGGSPWGFSLQGGVDHRSPLRVGRVTPGGRAAKAGLMAGDYILTINGQLTKSLKHLQAQQLIKNSKQSIELHCTKVRPGVTSPAVTMTGPPASFSFPTVVGSKPATSRPKAVSTVLKPLPPPTISNGHIRGGSLETPSESTTTISTPSPASSPSNIEVYNAKFIDLQCQECSSDQTTPHPSETTPLPSQTSLNGDSGMVEGSTTSSNDLLQPEEGMEEPLPQADSQSANDPVTTDSTPAPAEAETAGEEFGEELEGVTGIVEDIQQQVESLKEAAEEGKEGEEELDARVSSGEIAAGEREMTASGRNSFSKRELVDVISQAAQARARRDSSAETTNSTGSDEVASQPAVVPKPAPPPVKQSPPPVNKAPPTAAPAQERPVIKPNLTKKEDVAPLLTKDPGWYQQMFQTFSNTVQEAFPLAKGPDADPEYVYDERGLKVKSDKIAKVEQKAEAARKEVKSPEAPVYEYDERGLRVPVRPGLHVRGGSTPAVMQETEEEKKKKFISVSSGGTSKDDIVASSKKSTAYKTNQYSTGGTRNYWSQKDKEHLEFDKERRRSQEQIFHRRHSSSDFSAKMTSIHPLLKTEMEESAKSAEPATDGKVFERIDAGKLQGALKNASVLTSLEQEGVPSHLLPALAQHQAADSAEEAAKKEKKRATKPPPGPKAQANFNFQGKNEKELSFKKGDFLDLTGTVDENWLEGSIGGKEGIFPSNYVKVLTMADYEALTTPKPPTPTMQAKALFDFQGETQRELEFKKDDVVVIEKQVDDNWYSGRLGDKKGIFPVAYVQVIEP